MAISPPKINRVAYVIAASTTGSYHCSRGIALQDRFAFEIASDGLVVAVADGLGSAEKSAMGADLSVSAVLRLWQSWWGPLEDFCPAAMMAARQSLEAYSFDREIELRQLATTLMVVSARGGEISSAHVGDGAVVSLEGSEIGLLSPPGASEYANEVEHLAQIDWEKAMILTEPRASQGFMVFTDGCQRAGLSRNGEGHAPFEGFVRPLFDWASKVEDPEAGSNELRSLLCGEKLDSSSEDDKTLVIGMLG